MSWENELRPEIKLTSPESGTVFNALWKNNDISFTKKLGVFSIPKFSGDIIQDFDVKSTEYTLNIYFEGIFHNKTAVQFHKALNKERGQWEVVHPVKGTLILQLSSCREVVAPVDNGNYTEFELQFLEPANITRLISADELSSLTLSSVLNAIEDFTLQMQQMKVDSYAAIQSAIITMQKIQGFADTTIKALTETDPIIQEEYISAKATFTSAIAAFGIDNTDTSEVSQAMIDMLLVPVDSSDDFIDRYNNYDDLNEQFQSLVFTTTTDEDFNRAVTLEIAILACLIAISKIVATSDFKSRTEVISAINNITTTYNTAIEYLDEIQTLFINSNIEDQYFSIAKSYSRLVNTYSLSYEYLLQAFFNLRVEKIITLKNDRTPIDIVAEELGTFGEDDINYNEFISSNNLSGNEILILPAGREVIVYVG